MKKDGHYHFQCQQSDYNFQTLCIQSKQENICVEFTCLCCGFLIARISTRARNQTDRLDTKARRDAAIQNHGKAEAARAGCC